MLPKDEIQFHIESPTGVEKGKTLQSWRLSLYFGQLGKPEMSLYSLTLFLRSKQLVLLQSRCRVSIGHELQKYWNQWGNQRTILWNLFFYLSRNHS